MQLKEILAKLENNTGKFPHQALEKAIEEKETRLFRTCYAKILRIEDIFDLKRYQMMNEDLDSIDI